MAIRIVDTLTDLTGDATIVANGDDFDGEFYKDPETGHVEVSFEDYPEDGLYTLVLHDEHDSSYYGQFDEDGYFTTYTLRRV